jgi:hypothetical protein
MSQASRLTQSFLQLDDRAFRAVPILQKEIAETINRHLDEHHSTMGTVITALACTVGEFCLLSGAEAEQQKLWFAGILDAYISTGETGARTGPDTEPSLVRRERKWPWSGS